MAVTKGEMTSLPPSQTLFLQTVEEPEDSSRINFRDSLKFFQEQLVINGANLPCPSPIFCRSGNNTLRKNGHRSLPHKEQIPESNGKIPKDNDTFESDIQSLRSCKIAIPTVDTILESVRVLRAIQKSQEERGANWNLDVTPKSDVNFNNTDELIKVTDVKQNDYPDKESESEKNNETPSPKSLGEQIPTDVNQNAYFSKEYNNERNDELSLSNSLDKKTVRNVNENECFKAEADNQRNKVTSSTDTDAKQTVKDINQTGYSDREPNSESNDAVPLTNSKEKQTIVDINKNEYYDNGFNNEINDNAAPFNSVDKQTVTSTIQQEYADKEFNNEENVQTLSSTDSLDAHLLGTEGEEQIYSTKENHTQSQNDSQFCESNSQFVNEICSFWPSNTFENGSHLNGEKECDSSSILDENVSESLTDINLRNLNNTDSFQLNNNFDLKSVDKDNLTEQIRQSDVCNNNVLQNVNKSENCGNFPNLHEDIVKNIKNCDTPNSLREVCTDFLNHLNEKIPNTAEKSKEILLKGSEITSEILKIETYEDIDGQKHDHFVLNESLWKEDCSHHDSASKKIESNDSDSGIGTQRSASSLSPNNPSQMRKDSWSDTCSSHYASAECSPYHSLNSVFESSLGLNSTQGETGETETSEILMGLTEKHWEETLEKPQETISESSEDHILVPQQTDYREEKNHISDKYLVDSPIQLSELETDTENAELDTEISYCNFITNYTIEKPCNRVESSETAQPASDICDNNEEEPKTANCQDTTIIEHITDTKKNDEETVDNEETKSLIPFESLEEDALQDDSCDIRPIEKFTSASCDLISIVESLYTIKENPAYQVLPAGGEPEEKFEENLFVLSEGAFHDEPEGSYLVIIEESVLYITKESQILLSVNMKYGEISSELNILKIDNRMGRCVYVQCDFSDVLSLKARMELHCLKHWQTDCLQLVHYPLKSHKNVVIIDIGSCSTRAGILMDQPTLPTVFFPTICAADKRTGTCVYGMEALQPEVRQHSNLSFPVRPSMKITKHTIDIDLMEGLFKKIFHDLNVDPTEYTVQVCLPRNLSINAQTALVKLLLEGLKVKAVSLTNQSLLTLYAHDISTAVVVDIGDRTDVLPVVDGFIVENGVTKLPHGGQMLIHHMKHRLAEKRITLSTDIDSFVVQYIIENLAYVANDYDSEMRLSSQHPAAVTKTVTLQPATSKSLPCKSITLEEARFSVPEGLFNPELWGLDSPGIHHLVQKAIQATSVDARKRIAENIYVSGGVTVLPGFVERLQKEVTKLSKAKIVPKVYASNYRYHCTYIGACKFAKMEVFPQVCISLQDYTKDRASALKKCALYF